MHWRTFRQATGDARIFVGLKRFTRNLVPWRPGSECGGARRRCRRPPSSAMARDHHNGRASFIGYKFYPTVFFEDMAATGWGPPSVLPNSVASELLEMADQKRSIGLGRQSEQFEELVAAVFAAHGFKVQRDVRVPIEDSRSRVDLLLAWEGGVITVVEVKLYRSRANYLPDAKHVIADVLRSQAGFRADHPAIVPVWRNAFTPRS